MSQPAEPEPDSSPFDASRQLREQLHAAIRRSGLESDITVYAAIACLEVVKFDLLEQLTKATQ